MTLAELYNLHMKATPMPWGYNMNFRVAHYTPHKVFEWNWGDIGNIQTGGRGAANPMLICALRNMVPEIIALRQFLDTCDHLPDGALQVMEAFDKKLAAIGTDKYPYPIAQCRP